MRPDDDVFGEREVERTWGHGGPELEFDNQFDRWRREGHRVLLNIDSNGYHLREVLSVSKRLEIREVHYATRPIASGGTLAEAIANAQSHTWIKNE